MKTVRPIIIALIVLANSINAFAEGVSLSDSNEINPESTLTTDQKFEMTYDTLSQKIYVDIEGDFEELSSVSVASNRGSDLIFKFVEGSTGLLEFDVSDLKAGSYFVILNTGEEIRMKRFIKE